MERTGKDPFTSGNRFQDFQRFIQYIDDHGIFEPVCQFPDRRKLLITIMGNDPDRILFRRKFIQQQRIQQTTIADCSRAGRTRKFFNDLPGFMSAHRPDIQFPDQDLTRRDCPDKTGGHYPHSRLEMSGKTPENA